MSQGTGSAEEQVVREMVALALALACRQLADDGATLPPSKPMLETFHCNMTKLSASNAVA